MFVSSKLSMAGCGCLGLVGLVERTQRREDGDSDE